MRINKRNRHTLRPVSARVACLLVASMVGIQMSAVPLSRRPALVVGIMVDGLSNESLDMLRDYFGTDGFNRLLTNGVTIDNLDYGTHLEAPAATAVIYTGAAPSVNGIDSDSHFNPETRLVTPTLHDPSVMGNYTDRTLSASAIRTSTLGDELRIASGGLGYVYAIAPDATQSVVMAGHAGNSGVWLDELTGRWASSTYYSEMPAVITAGNRMSPLSSRLDTLAWTPARDITTYPDLPTYKKLYPFRQTFLRDNPHRYKAYSVSAPMNTEITDIAGEYLRTLQLGRHEGTDMLSLSYCVQPFSYGRDADTRAELIDSYIRLDSQLAQLFRAIDSHGPGMANTLIFVAGTPVDPVSRRDDEKWRIPGGEFSPRKAASLLNMYLMAIHGNAEWVAGIHDGQVYLNRRVIKDRDKNLEEMRRQAAEFMVRLSGVSHAVSLDDVTAHRHISDRQADNIDLSLAGDVLFTVTPGWHIENEGNPDTVVRANACTSAPAFILAPGIAQRTISHPVDARAIAPTVAGILRIRSPNAASVAPLRLNFVI